jgi:cystathionine beta-synthase
MKDGSLPADKSKRVYDDIRGSIGWTPLVRLGSVARGLACPLYAKLEMFNPGGSVKDRIAYRIVEAYEASGDLKPGGTVVEATSGNTGVGLAIACATKGYQAIFVMPDKMSEDKVRLLRAYGARVVITPTAVAPDDPRSYYSVAKRLVAETPDSVLANQYHNQENPRSHYEQTGPEIWQQTDGRVTDIVIGMGTGGTITGVAQYLRDQGREVKIVGVDPEGSILHDAWERGGSADGLEATTYKVEGIGEDFIPSTLDLQLVNQVVQVDDAESFLWARRMVREEGILCGGSSGAALAGAVKYATDLPADRLVVVIMPDSGDRYLSKLFNDDWMREHGFLPVEQRRVTASEIVKARGRRSLITAMASDRIAGVIERLRENGIDQLPVIDEQGRLEGVVSEVELLDHMLNSRHDHPADETIAGIINRDVRTAGPESPLADLLPDLMARKAVILVEPSGHPVGILSSIDALDYLSPLEDHEALA